MDYAKDCLNHFPTLWMDTAHEADLSTPLDGDQQCDVAIVGGGYTGLAAAMTLARRGANVRLLEGSFPGWGGSGRNSGSVIRGFKNSRSDLIRTYGEERGRAMADFGARTTDVVMDFISEYGIQCDLKRTGWLLPSHNAAGIRRIEERVRTWTADGFTGLDIVGREELAGLLGSNAYIGGMIDREGASINPLSYARGLVRAAIGHGAHIHCQTPAIAIKEAAGGWAVSTPRGTVKAKAVILATDAYSRGLNAAIDDSYVSIHTFIVVTAPLPDAVADTILPGEHAASDSRRILNYWHKTPDRRVLFGTRGTLNGPYRERDFSHVEKAMLQVYPQLEGQSIEYRWAGKVGLTRDFMPHIDQPQPGLWTAHGYCGRGVAMASAYGKLLGETVLGNGSLSALPVPNTPAPRMPPPLLRNVGIVAATQLYRALDVHF